MVLTHTTRDTMDGVDGWFVEKEVVAPFELEIFCENFATGHIYVNTYKLQKVKLTKNGNLKFFFVPTVFEGGYIEGPRWVAYEDFVCEVFEKDARLYRCMQHLAQTYTTEEVVIDCDEDDFSIAHSVAATMKKIIRKIWKDHFEALSFFNLDFVDFSK